MKRWCSIGRLAMLAVALLPVLGPGAGVAAEEEQEEATAPAVEYEWRSCDEGKILFIAPKGWQLESEEVADGVVACTLAAGPDGRVTLKHWSRWPVEAGVQPGEYAVSAVERLSRGRQVVDRGSGAKGSSIAHRIEVVDTGGDDPLHRWVLFVHHPKVGTLDMVTAEWPESAWDEAWAVVRPVITSLRLADQQ